MSDPKKQIFLVESDDTWRNLLQATIQGTFGEICEVVPFTRFEEGWKARDEAGADARPGPAAMIAGDQSGGNRHQGLKLAQILTESDKTRGKVPLLIVSDHYLQDEVTGNPNVTALFSKDKLGMDEFLSAVAKALGANYIARYQNPPVDPDKKARG